MIFIQYLLLLGKLRNLTIKKLKLNSLSAELSRSFPGLWNDNN